MAETGGPSFSRGRTAVLVDGAFFTRRSRRPLGGNPTPIEAADAVERLAAAHLAAEGRRSPRDLYRVFFYDCPPLTKRGVHRPVSGATENFAATPEAVFTTRLHEELRKRRKLALRLGDLDDRNVPWVLRENRLRTLLDAARSRPEWRGVAPAERTVDLLALTDDDFKYDPRQKGVDMRIGLDIASLALKRQVDQIVLVAGDSDFVPAAKLARREGIDFLLDPLGAGIKSDLNEHVDGVRSVAFAA